MPGTTGACEVKPARMFGEGPPPQVEGGFREKGRYKKTVLKKARDCIFYSSESLVYVLLEEN